VKKERLRPGQLSALDVCIDRLAEGESHTAIVLPTRYGKSDLMRLIAHEATAQHFISGAIAFSPYESLTKQLVKVDKVQEMVMRYGLDFGRAFKIRQLRSFNELKPFSNGEYLLAANIQLAYQENIGSFLQLADYEKRITNLPLALMIDECQFVSEQKKWGEFLAEAVKVGCLLILMTATPIREDGETIPGFDVEILNSEDERRFFWSDAGDGKHNRIDVWDGARQLVRLKAHHETTFKEAWDEDPSPLCFLSREIVDMEVNPNGEDEPTMLSQLTDSQSKKCLGRVTRDATFIELGVRKMLECLAAKKRLNKRCAAIVFTGNDQQWSVRDNEHAETVKEQIESCGRSYLDFDPEVMIVTMKTGKDEAKAEKKLDVFVGNEKREGRGDILIVKNIGGAGLDCPRLKVVLDLSPVRSVASVIQRLTRVATPYEGISVADVVTARDQRMEALWSRFIVEQGGELDHSDIWVPDIKVRTYLKEKEERKDDSEILLGSTEFSGYDDSKGNIGKLENYAAIRWLMNEFPEVGGRYTKAELSAKVARLSSLSTPNPEPTRAFRSLDNDIREGHQQLNTTANEIVMQRLGGLYNRDKYEREQKDIWKRTYQSVGLPIGTHLDAIVERNTIAQLQEAMERLR
jgi:superfamily II DNA or RNA helicase